MPSISREWATTESASFYTNQDSAPDPVPPPGEGWRLVAAASVVGPGVILYWFWERERVQEEQPNY